MNHGPSLAARSRPACRIVGCSDGLATDRRPRVAAVAEYVATLGFAVEIDERIFVDSAEAARPAAIRAEMLLSALVDPNVALILDVTGGDATSSMLRELPPAIPGRGAGTIYVGASDNTTVHAVLARGAPDLLRVYWYPTNLVLESAPSARTHFEYVLETRRQSSLNVTWVRGEGVTAPVVGGNIRCLLKLAGTRFVPDTSGAVLLLESGSGGLARMQAFFDQLFDCGTIQSLRAIVLGDFGGLGAAEKRTLSDYVLALVPRDVSVGLTSSVGHGSDAVPVIFGLPLSSPA